MSQESEDYITPIFPVTTKEEIELEENDSTENMDDYDENEFLMLGGAARRLWPTVEQYKTKFLDMFTKGYSSVTSTYLPALKLSGLVPNTQDADDKIKTKLPEGGGKDTSFKIIQQNLFNETTRVGTYRIKELKKLTDFVEYPKIFSSSSQTAPVFYLSVFLTKALQLALDLDKKAKTPGTKLEENEMNQLFLLGEIVVRLYILFYINIFTQNDLCIDKPASFDLYTKFVVNKEKKTYKFSDLLTEIKSDLENATNDKGIKVCLFGKDTVNAERETALNALYDLLKDFGMIYLFNEVLNVDSKALLDSSKVFFFENMKDFLEKMIGSAVTAEKEAEAARKAKADATARDACSALKAKIDKLSPETKKALTDADITGIGSTKEVVEKCFKDFPLVFSTDSYGFAAAAAPPAVDICEHLKKEIDTKITKKEDRLKITDEQIKTFMKPDGKTSYTKAEVEACLKAKKGSVLIFSETEYKLAPVAAPAGSFTPEQEKLVNDLISSSPHIPKIPLSYIVEKLAQEPYKTQKVTIDIVKKIFEKINKEATGIDLAVDDSSPKIEESTKYDEIIAESDGWCFYNSIVRQLDATQEKKEKTVKDLKDVNPNALAGKIKRYINDYLDPERKKQFEQMYNFLNKPETYANYINELDDESKKRWADPDFGIGLGAAYMTNHDISIFKKGNKENEYIHIFTYTVADSNTALRKFVGPSPPPPRSSAGTLKLLYVNKDHYNILSEKAPTASSSSSAAASSVTEEKIAEMKTELPAFLDSIEALKTLINENKELKVKKTKEGGGEEEVDLFTPEEKARIGEITGFFDTEKAKLSGDVTKENFTEKEKTLLAIVDELNGKSVQSILEKLMPQLRSEEAMAKYAALLTRGFVIPRGASAAASSSALGVGGDKWTNWYNMYGDYVLKAMASFAADAKTLETYLLSLTGDSKLNDREELSLKDWVSDVVGKGKSEEARVAQAKDVLARITEKIGRKESIEGDVKTLGNSLFDMNKALKKLGPLTEKVTDNTVPAFAAASRIKEVGKVIPDLRLEGYAMSTRSNAAAEKTPYTTDLLAIGATGDYSEGTLGNYISTFELPGNTVGGAKSKGKKKGSRKNRKQDRKTRKASRGRNTRRKNRKA